MAIYEERIDNPETKVICVTLGELLENYCYSQKIEWHDIQNKNLDKNTEICFFYEEVE